MRRHPALWLTICLLAFYVLLGNDRIVSGDGEAMFQVTRALAQRGRLDLPPNILPPVDTILVDSPDTQIPYTLVGYDGRTYSKYGLGQSLAALPLYLLGMAWQAVTGTAHAPRTAAILLNSLLTAGTAGLLLLLARSLGYSTRTGVLLSLAFALCSPAWVYTHSFFSEPLVTFCLTAAALAAIRFSQAGQARWLALTGGMWGLALLTRIDALAALPAFGLYLAMTWWARRRPVSVVFRQALVGLAACSIGVGLMLLYNVARFGNPFDWGYGTANWQASFFQGLYGLTLSPGKGLLWYAPPILLGVLGLPRLGRRLPREVVLCGGVLAGYVLLHSFYTYWEGGWCWGPRLILPALPFAILPAGALLDHQHQAKMAELGMALVLALGLLIQIPAVGSSHVLTLQRVYGDSPQDFQDRVLYQPRHSPVLGQWQSLLEVTANLRNDTARSQIAALMAQAQPEESTLSLAESPAEALRLERQTILSLNLPDLWLVSTGWLRQEPAQ